MVSRVAECYNFIHKEVHPCEIGQIANAIAELDAALALCTNEAKWSNYGQCSCPNISYNHKQDPRRVFTSKSSQKYDTFVDAVLSEF